MRIKIFGKVHRSGVSRKSGNKYDFIELHFSAPSRDVIGESAQTITMDAGLYPFEQINFGLYDAQFDNKGNLLSLAPIQAQPPVATK